MKQIKNWESYPSFARRVDRGEPCRVEGISGCAGRYFAAAFAVSSKRKKLVYIAPDDFSAKRAAEDLETFLGGGVLLLEPSDYMFFNAFARNRDREYKRVLTLKKLASGDYTALVLSPASLMQFTVAPDRFENCDFYLKEGADYDLSSLADKLSSMGYVRTGMVDGPRQFSIRGDIFDVFPTSSEMPYRAFFFGDTIDVINMFDPVTQRSVQRVGDISVSPESEIRLAEVDPALIKRNIETSCAETCRDLVQDGSLATRFRNEAKSAISLINEGAEFQGMDRYIPFIIGRDHNVLEYCKDAIVFCEDRLAILKTADVFLEEHVRICETISHVNFTPHELFDFFMSTREVADIIDKKAIKLETFDEEQEAVLTEERLAGAGLTARTFSKKLVPKGLRPEDAPKEYPDESGSRTFKLKANRVSSAAGNEITIRDYLADWYEKGLTVYVASERRDRFERLIKDLEKITRDLPEVECVRMGKVEDGFEMYDAGFALVSERSFFAVAGGGAGKKNKKSKDEDLFNDIRPGDYIVHDIHGIGIFRGIEAREVSGVTKDYVVIEYAGGGKLFLPSLELGTVHRYVGKEDAIPRISTLGSKDWQREKERVKRSLREYVEELAQLYAKRRELKGFAFPKDDELQADFERKFEFEPTSDQLVCAEEIKTDMELTKPMDRLLCGDVGFGKTEVAFRAAFKAVAAGKQVAILAPTTVLCQQHFFTAVERFADFPVNIDYICRFRSSADIKKIKDRLKSGDIDIIIGTHALIKGKDIEFKDLGLIVVDEEQRFGVMQKEKLNLMYPLADTLYMSATPIPRTLNMSLSKIRDISVITEAPKNRNPVQTYVIKISDDVVRNAILREMARNGQVFYLYNRVKTINDRLEWLGRLVPEARICVAHGQMPEHELERVMRDFIARKYDVMLCSTIIESGLDIANANTIIVEHGERLGLAQMYQIRGRVGRSDVRAYAYITYPDEEDLTSEAWQRLKTIKEFTEFGSGIKVAMRDLEIRGAGSVFGERQSGDVVTIGYDLYNRMLNDMITEVTGGPAKEDVTVTVDFTVSSYIPGDYISLPDARMEIHRKIAAVSSDNDILDMQDELLERFPGEIPQNIINLMHLSYIKALAAECGITSVVQFKYNVEMDVCDEHLFDTRIKDNYKMLSENYRGRFNVMASEKRIYARYTIPDKVSLYKHADVIESVEKFLKVLAGKK